MNTSVKIEEGNDKNVAMYNRFEWPSKSSVLETPERKRSRCSTSFADSGLGSSIFGSPPSKWVTVPVLDTLKTPTKKKSPNMSSPNSPSSLRSFLHVSPYSDAFVRPNSCSPPSKIRLTNPGKAVEFKFSGVNVPELELPINMADDEVSGAVPSTSFKDSSLRSACRSLGSQLTRSLTRSSAEDENEDNVMEISVPLETPSKGFRNELNMATNYVDDGFSLLTPIPMLGGPSDYDCSRSQLYLSSHYTVPEQANGPLESSLCESVDQFRVHDTEFCPMTESVISSTMRTSPTEDAVPVYRKVGNVNQRFYYISNSSNQSRTCLREANNINRPFRPPKRALKVNSKRWLQITCGETPHQMEMTRMAKFFMDQVTFS